VRQERAGLVALVGELVDGKLEAVTGMVYHRPAHRATMDRCSPAREGVAGGVGLITTIM